MIVPKVSVDVVVIESISTAVSVGVFVKDVLLSPPAVSMGVLAKDIIPLVVSEDVLADERQWPWLFWVVTSAKEQTGVSELFNLAEMNVKFARNTCSFKLT